MGALIWDPPGAAALLLAATALVVWVAAAPPWRAGPASGILRGAAALLLLLALVDVGCRRAEASRPLGRLVVLLDRSHSMALPASEEASRGEAGRAWLESERFRDWTEGWEVTVDSFGGGTSDPGGAVEAAASALPQAILILSDGRAAEGRSVEPPPVPLYAHAPGAAAILDAAVSDLTVTLADDGSSVAIVELAAVGGRPVDGPGELVLRVDGRAVARRAVEGLAAGEARVLRLPFPAAGGAARIVEAGLEMPGDRVTENDRRAWVEEPRERPDRAIAIGLLPGWDFAAWLRVLRTEHPGPVDAFWVDRRGRLAAVDGAGGARAWAALDPGRYGVLYLLGDPAALGETGRGWVARFLSPAGRGLLWGPQGRGGRLVGADVDIPMGAAAGVPAVPASGRAWLTALGADTDGPDGTAAWPPLEGLPASPVPATPGATTLLEVGGSPVAWAAERGGSRVVVALGTGYYRWPLEAAGDGPEGAAEAQAGFWRDWSGAIARWLAAASPTAGPLVRMPPGGRVRAGAPLEAGLAAEPGGSVGWRIEDATGEEVASGEVEPAGRAPGAAPARAIHAGPFEPGRYRLAVESGGRRAIELFVVETWAPEFASTAADTGSLAAAARASGGAYLDGGSLPPLPAAEREDPAGAARATVFRFGTEPWAYLLAAILLLADWAVAGRRSR